MNPYYTLWVHAFGSNYGPTIHLEKISVQLWVHKIMGWVHYGSLMFALEEIEAIYVRMYMHMYVHVRLCARAPSCV